MGIVGHSSVDEFFREVLCESLDSAGVKATELTEHYLVGLLGNYAKARISDEPLSLVLVESHESPAERVRALKHVGDTSLYLTGFFAESLNSKLVAADYYMSLGSAAYGELASRLHSSSIHSVYEELAARFPRFVDVLGEVRERINFVGTDVVKLYEQWLESRSEWVEGRLRSLGVIVGDGKKEFVQ